MKNQAKNKTAPLTAAPLKCATVTNAPVIIAPIRTAALFLLLLTVLLFLVGCKTKHTISEKTITKTDSTAIWNLNDSLYKKETQITILQSDLQRLSDENFRLLNETSTHQISYDTSAPLNPQTGKPPITSEVITISKSTLEQTKKEYETLLQTITIENESLILQHRNLQLTFEKLINVNKQLSEKTNYTGLNLKLFLFGDSQCNYLFYFAKIFIDDF